MSHELCMLRAQVIKQRSSAVLVMISRRRNDALAATLALGGIDRVTAVATCGL